MNRWISKVRPFIREGPMGALYGPQGGPISKFLNPFLGQLHGSFEWTSLLSKGPRPAQAHLLFSTCSETTDSSATPLATIAFQKARRGRGREDRGGCAPLHPPHENVRRGQARGRGGCCAGGAPGLLRGPQGSGLGVPAGGGAQDPAQERRHEGGDAAGGLRHRPRRVREAYHGEGHRRVHQEGVRQEPRPDLALHRRPQLWFIRDTRNKLLCVFLHRFKSRLAIQVWVTGAADVITLACLHPITLLYVPISESSAAKAGSLEFVSLHVDVSATDWFRVPAI